MIARGQHIGHQPIAITLHSAAQRLDLGGEIAVDGSDIAECNQPRDHRTGIGDGSCSGLVDDSKNIKACNKTGVLGCLTL